MPCAGSVRHPSILGLVALASACSDASVLSTEEGRAAAASPPAAEAAAPAPPITDAGPDVAAPASACSGCRDTECCKDGACWPGMGDDACGSNGAVCATCGATSACRQALTPSGGVPASGFELGCAPALPDGAACNGAAECKGGFCTSGRCAGAACLPAGASCKAGCCPGLSCGGASAGGGLGVCCYPKGAPLPGSSSNPPPSSVCCDGRSAAPTQAGTWTCL